MRISTKIRLAGLLVFAFIAGAAHGEGAPPYGWTNATLAPGLYGIGPDGNAEGLTVIVGPLTLCCSNNSTIGFPSNCYVDAPRVVWDGVSSYASVITQSVTRSFSASTWLPAVAYTLPPNGYALSLSPGNAPQLKTIPDGTFLQFQLPAVGNSALANIYFLSSVSALLPGGAWGPATTIQFSQGLPSGYTVTTQSTPRETANISFGNGSISITGTDPNRQAYSKTITSLMGGYVVQYSSGVTEYVGIQAAPGVYTSWNNLGDGYTRQWTGRSWSVTMDAVAGSNATPVSQEPLAAGLTIQVSNPAPLTLPTSYQISDGRYGTTETDSVNKDGVLVSSSTSYSSQTLASYNAVVGTSGLVSNITMTQGSFSDKTVFSYNAQGVESGETYSNPYGNENTKCTLGTNGLPVTGAGGCTDVVNGVVVSTLNISTTQNRASGTTSVSLLSEQGVEGNPTTTSLYSGAVMVSNDTGQATSYFNSDGFVTSANRYDSAGNEQTVFNYLSSTNQTLDTISVGGKTYSTTQTDTLTPGQEGFSVVTSSGEQFGATRNGVSQTTYSSQGPNHNLIVTVQRTSPTQSTYNLSGNIGGVTIGKAYQCNESLSSSTRNCSTTSVTFGTLTTGSETNNLQGLP